jgi:acetolactate synthase I/II/III large subunit
MAVDEAAVDEVAHLLRRAGRPAIIAGYGVILSRAQDILLRLLEVAPCPVVHTLPGKAALLSLHACNYGMLGMHGLYTANWIVHHADLLLSLGSRSDARITGAPRQFAPQAQRLGHFDLDAAPSRQVLPERQLGVLGDLKQTLTALYERVHNTPLDLLAWHNAIAQVEAQDPSTYKRQPERLQTQ